MNDHDKAVRKLLNSRFQTHDVKQADVDHLEGYPNPSPISGETPGIFLKFKNGKEKIIEVDTRPMSPNDKRQDRVFQNSADAKPNIRSYEHFFASDVLRDR